MKLKEDKACGPDELHPKLLKQCAVLISKPLLILLKNIGSRLCTKRLEVGKCSSTTQKRIMVKGR